ncbi:hypothetical protein PFTANZ_05625 [Plasmodium falciparum Tanzania (2000708)]|uniref:Uncharacterized protein n=1 Tax=Plasmodium falciparum Tanzania (2000708) TaxID=1036725 RepID=A0A024VZB3_PLAFA|nr:hypothetical protein PFTANZ_05625 [Plasmodium falciparum Tanzania (2000708)]
MQREMTREERLEEAKITEQIIEDVTKLGGTCKKFGARRREKKNMQREMTREERLEEAKITEHVGGNSNIYLLSEVGKKRKK